MRISDWSSDVCSSDLASLSGALDRLNAGAPEGQTAEAMPDMDGAADADPQGEREVLYWYDPMRPERHFDKPGKSPLMDMQLVPKYAAEAGTDDAGPDRKRTRLNSRH